MPRKGDAKIVSRYVGQCAESVNNCPVLAATSNLANVRHNDNTCCKLL
jgi:hypothetical protein